MGSTKERGANLLFSLRLTVGTKRGLSLVLGKTLGVFGLISAGFGFWAAVTVPTKPLTHVSIVVALTAGGSLLAAFLSSFPRAAVSQSYTRPGMTVTVRRGDLFDQEGQLVVGFTDTFDTDTTRDLVISTKSVQGQLLQRVFDGDTGGLDDLLDDALHTVDSEPIRRADKPHGKLRRFPIGTTAVVERGPKRIYCVAYSRMGDDLVAKSSVDDLWRSLGLLWDEVYRRGQHETVVLPIIGSELARIHCVDRESLIRTILLSFVARSREQLLCKELVVVVHPSDATKVNMLEVAAFMRTL
jgi:hypothetical protein